MITHFFKNQLLNIPAAVLFFFPFVMTFFSLGTTKFNAYLLSGWEDGMGTIFAILIFTCLFQGVGWYYWIKKLRSVDDKRLVKRGYQLIGMELMIVAVLSFCCLIDLSPEAKVKAVNYQLSVEERKAKQQAYQNHLKQLPEDVTLQSLGAYLLTFEAGESFVAYLNLSNELFEEKLTALKLNPGENEVLNYLYQLDPTMSNDQIHALAFELHRDSDIGFMSVLTEPFNPEPSFIANPLYGHIIGFETMYFESLLSLILGDKIDEEVMIPLLEGIIFRLEHAKSIPGLNTGDLEFLARHQSFYVECLSYLEKDSTLLRGAFKTFRNDNHLYWSDLEPYEEIAHYFSRFSE